MLPKAGKIMGDRRSWNTQTKNEALHGKSPMKAAPKLASGSREAFSKVLGNYTSNNVRLLSLQLYNYLNETREKVKRTHRFLKLANQKFLFVHFFACRVAQETNQYPLDFYMKESLVAYILLELNIINEPEFSGDFSHQTALKERVTRLLWTIYSKYMYYLTGRSNRVEVYAIICKFLQAELPPKIPDFFRDFVQVMKSHISNTTIHLSYFSAPLDIKVEPATTPQNMICADPNTPNSIWERFKEMQKRADDHQLQKDHGECIVIDEDDDVEEVCAAPFQVRMQNPKREREPYLRVPSAQPSEEQETQHGTRGLVDKGKAVLLEFQKLFGSEGVSMSINSEGKLVVATTLSLDQESRPRTNSVRSNPVSSEGAPAWTSSHTYPPSCDSRTAPLRQLLSNFSPHRPYFEVGSSTRPENHNPALQQSIAEFSVANFGPKPIEAVPPNRHEQMQGSNLPVDLPADSGDHLAGTEGRCEGPMDLSKHVGIEKPPKQPNAGLNLVTNTRAVEDSSSDQVLRAEPVEKPKTALNVLSVVVVKKDLRVESRQVSRDFELCIVEDEKTGRVSAEQQFIEASDPLSVSNVDDSDCDAIQTDTDKALCNLGYAAVIGPAQTAELSVNPVLVLDEQHQTEAQEPLLQGAEVPESSNEALSQGYNGIENPASQEIVENPSVALLSVATPPLSSLGCDETQCNPGHAAAVDPVQNPTDIVTAVPIPDIYPVELINLAGIAAAQPYQLCEPQDAASKGDGSDSTSSDSDKLYIDIPEHPDPARNSSAVKRHKTKAELKQKVAFTEDKTDVDDLPLKNRFKTELESPRNRRRSNSQKGASGKSPARKSNSSPTKPRKSASDVTAAEKMDLIYTAKLRSRSLKVSNQEDVAPSTSARQSGRPRGRPRKKSITNKMEEATKPVLVTLPSGAQVEEERKQPQLSKVLSRLKENLKNNGLEVSEQPELLSVQSKKRKQVKRASFAHVTAETPTSAANAEPKLDNSSVIETTLTMFTPSETKLKDLEPVLSEEIAVESQHKIAAKEESSLASDFLRECEVTGDSSSCSQQSPNAKVGKDNLLATLEISPNCPEDCADKPKSQSAGTECVMDKTEVQEEKISTLEVNSNEQATVEADTSKSSALPVVSSNEAAPSKQDEETILLNFTSEYEIEAMESANEDELLDTSDEEDGLADSRSGKAEAAKLTQGSVQSNCCEASPTEPKQVEGNATAPVDGDSDVGSSIVPGENPAQIVAEGLKGPIKTMPVGEVAVKLPDCNEISNRINDLGVWSLSEVIEEPKSVGVAVTVFEDEESAVTEAFSLENTLEASLEQQSQPKSDQMDCEAEKIDNNVCAAVADHQEPVKALQSTNVDVVELNQERVDPVVALPEERQTEGAWEVVSEELKQVEVDPIVTVSDEGLSGVVEELTDVVVSEKCQQRNSAEEVTRDLKEMEVNADVVEGAMLVGQEESHVEDSVSGAEELEEQANLAEELRKMEAVPEKNLLVLDKEAQIQYTVQDFVEGKNQDKIKEASEELNEMDVAGPEEYQQEKRAEEVSGDLKEMEVNASVTEGAMLVSNILDTVSDEKLREMEAVSEQESLLVFDKEGEQQEKGEEVTEEPKAVDLLVAVPVDGLAGVDKEVQIEDTIEAFEESAGQAAEEVNQLKVSLPVAEEVQFEELVKDSKEASNSGAFADKLKHIEADGGSKATVLVGNEADEEKSEKVDELGQTASVTFSNVPSEECEVKIEAPPRSDVSKDILFIGNEAFDVEFIDHTEDSQPRAVVPKAPLLAFRNEAEEERKANDVFSCSGSSRAVAEELKLTENTGPVSLAPIFSDKVQFCDSSRLSKEIPPEVQEIGDNRLVEVSEGLAEESLEDRDFINVPALAIDFDLEIGKCDMSFMSAECQVKTTVEDPKSLEAKCTEEVRVTFREQSLNGLEGHNKPSLLTAKQPVRDTRERRKAEKRTSPSGWLDGSKKAKLDDGDWSQKDKKRQERQQVEEAPGLPKMPVAKKRASDSSPALAKWQPKDRKVKQQTNNVFLVDDIPIDKSKVDKYFKHLGERNPRGLDAKKSEPPKGPAAPEAEKRLKTAPKGSKSDKILSFIDDWAAVNSRKPEDSYVSDGFEILEDTITNHLPVPINSVAPSGCSNASILESLAQYIKVEEPKYKAPVSMPKAAVQRSKTAIIQKPKAGIQKLRNKESDISELSTLLTRKSGREQIQAPARKGNFSTQEAIAAQPPQSPISVQSPPVGKIPAAKPRKQLFLEAISSATEPSKEDSASRKTPKVKPEGPKSLPLKNGDVEQYPEVGKEPNLKVREQPNKLDDQPKDCFEFVPYPLEVPTDDNSPILDTSFGCAPPRLESFEDPDFPERLASLQGSLMRGEPTKPCSQLSEAAIESSNIACNGSFPYFNSIEEYDTWISGKSTMETVDNSLKPIVNSPPIIAGPDVSSTSTTNLEEWTTQDILAIIQNSSIDDMLAQSIEAFSQLPTRYEEVLSSRGKTGSTEAQNEHECAAPPEPSLPTEAPPTKRRKRTLPNPEDRATKRRSAKTKPQNYEPTETIPKIKRESSRQAAREMEEVLKLSVLETSNKEVETSKKEVETSNKQVETSNKEEDLFVQVKKQKTSPFFMTKSKSLTVDVEKPLPKIEVSLMLPKGNKGHVYAPILSRRDFKAASDDDESDALDSYSNFPYD